MIRRFVTRSEYYAEPARETERDTCLASLGDESNPSMEADIMSGSSAVEMGLS